MTVTITATPEPDATPPRVRLDIASDQATVVPYRISAEGIRTPVRTYSGGPLPISSGAALLYDTEAGIGQPVTYTADGTGVTNSATVTITGDTVWLVHPGVPSLSQPIRAVSMSARKRAANQSIRYPVGARYPLVAHDGQRKAAGYELKIRTTTLTELDGINTLLDDLAALLLNVPATRNWGVGAEYVAIGDLEEGRLMNWGAHPYREWTLPCWVTDRPIGGTQSDNTYARSYALYPTYAARYAAAATYKLAFDS